MSAYRCMPRLREARTSISPRKGGRRPERGDVGRDRGILTYQTSDYSKKSPVCIYSNDWIVRSSTEYKYGIRNTDLVSKLEYGIRNTDCKTLPKAGPHNTDYEYRLRNTDLASKLKYRIRIRNTEYGLGFKAEIQNTNTEYGIRTWLQS
jgi:hypothetical protein